MYRRFQDTIKYAVLKSTQERFNVLSTRSLDKIPILHVESPQGFISDIRFGNPYWEYYDEDNEIIKIPKTLTNDHDQEFQVEEIIVNIDDPSRYQIGTWLVKLSRKEEVTVVPFLV